MSKSCSFGRISHRENSKSAGEGEAYNRARGKSAPTGIASNGESRGATNISCKRISWNRGRVQWRLRKPISLLIVTIKSASCRCHSRTPYHFPFYAHPSGHAWAISLFPTTSFPCQPSLAFSVRHPFAIYTALYTLRWSSTTLRSVYIFLLCVANVHAT